MLRGLSVDLKSFFGGVSGFVFAAVGEFMGASAPETIFCTGGESVSPSLLFRLVLGSMGRVSLFDWVADGTWAGGDAGGPAFWFSGSGGELSRLISSEIPA